MTLTIELTRRQTRATQEQRAATALAAIQRCEEQLAEARRAYSKAVSATGADTAGCFAESQFVKRSSAEKWEKLAREEGFAGGKLAAKKADNDREEDPNPYPDEDTGDEPDEGDDSPTDGPDNKSRKKKSKKAAAPKDASDDEDSTASALTGSAYEQHVRATAAAIIAAGQKARGIKPSPKQAAARIYESNCRVIEAEVSAGLPAQYTADLIISAGKRRRGEL